MSAPDSDVLAIPIRNAWLPLPASSLDQSIESIVGELALGADDAEGLINALHAVSATAAALPAGARRNYALVVSPGARRVEALLSIRVSTVTGKALADYLAAAESVTSDDRAEIIDRSIREAELAAGRAVISHDFLLPASSGGIALPTLERGFLALFPTDRSTMIEFTIITQNLALFDDLAEYMIALVNGEDPLPPGMEA